MLIQALNTIFIYEHSIFNHKGGVSKTTTTFHLGWMLAERGSRVLVVDADPQCNLTSLIMQDGFDEYYTEDTTKHLNIKDGVNLAFDGKPTPIEQADTKAKNIGAASKSELDEVLKEYGQKLKG